MAEGAGGHPITDGKWSVGATPCEQPISVGCGVTMGLRHARTGPSMGLRGGGTFSLEELLEEERRDELPRGYHHE